MSASAPKLSHGFTYASLFQVEDLQRLDELFLARLCAHDADRYERLLAYRRGDHGFTALEISELLLGGGPVLEDLVAELFGIQDALRQSRETTVAHDPVFAFKKHFVQRRARRRLVKNEELESFAELDGWLARAARGRTRGARP